MNSVELLAAQEAAEKTRLENRATRAAGSIPGQLGALGDRVAALESRGGGSVETEDSIRGTLRAFGERVLALETELSRWHSSASTLQNRLTAAETKIAALEAAAAAKPQQ
jgi:chromosome segregation ATPase